MSIDDFIFSNPFDFKQGIINHCRTIDKLDVYEWVAEDELMINKLKKENQKYKEVIDKLKDKTKENIENAKCEITTLTIGDKSYYQYIEKMLDNYVDILKEVE